MEWGEPENPAAQKAILLAVSDQLENNKPPEARKTLNRLLAEGYSEMDARKLIAAALAHEMYCVMREEREPDHEGYVASLEALPELPWG